MLPLSRDKVTVSSKSLLTSSVTSYAGMSLTWLSSHQMSSESVGPLTMFRAIFCKPCAITDGAITSVRYITTNGALGRIETESTSIFLHGPLKNSLSERESRG